MNIFHMILIFVGCTIGIVIRLHFWSKALSLKASVIVGLLTAIILIILLSNSLG